MIDQEIMNQINSNFEKIENDLNNAEEVENAHKSELKETLIELFKNGSIKIEHEIRNTWVSKDLITRIIIDDEKVYENEVELESK